MTATAKPQSRRLEELPMRMLGENFKLSRSQWEELHFELTHGTDGLADRIAEMLAEGTPYTVRIESAFEGGKARSIVVDHPKDFEGNALRSCEAVARYYAAEFCDSGSVIVTRGVERGAVHRKAVSA